MINDGTREKRNGSNIYDHSRHILRDLSSRRPYKVERNSERTLWLTIKHDGYTEVRLASTALRKRTIWDVHCQTESRKESGITPIHSSQVLKAFRSISGPKDREKIQSTHQSLNEGLGGNFRYNINDEMTSCPPKQHSGGRTCLAKRCNRGVFVE